MNTLLGDSIKTLSSFADNHIMTATGDLKKYSNYKNSLDSIENERTENQFVDFNLVRMSTSDPPLGIWNLIAICFVAFLVALVCVILFITFLRNRFRLQNALLTKSNTVETDLETECITNGRRMGQTNSYDTIRGL